MPGSRPNPNSAFRRLLAVIRELLGNPSSGFGLVPETTGFLLIDAVLAGDWEVFRDAINHLLLPASILGYSSMAYITRMTRSFMLDQLNQEYVITARVKGLSKGRTIWHHAFANIRVQLVTIVALAYGSLLEGAVLIETVFSWPGFGQYITNNMLIGDMNAVMTCVLLVGIIFIALNLPVSYTHLTLPTICSV